VSCKLTANAQGFVSGWDLAFVCPELMLIEKLMMKITTKSQIAFRQAGIKAQ